MRATEITMQVVKNIGNYETVRLQATFELLPTESVTDGFKHAKNELEAAFKEAYSKEILASTYKPAERKKLEIDTSAFIRICKALNENKTDYSELQTMFEITQPALKYLVENKLISL